MELQERAYRPIEAVQHRVLTGAFAWMTAGLCLTGITAFLTASSPRMLELIYGNQLIFWGLILAELGLVFTLAGAVQRLGSGAGTTMFLLFSVLNGLTLSSIFLLYTGASLTSTFLIAAGMFGGVALYGFVTRRDLTSVGSFFFMGLIGIVLGGPPGTYRSSRTWASRSRVTARRWPARPFWELWPCIWTSSTSSCCSCASWEAGATEVAAGKTPVPSGHPLGAAYPPPTPPLPDPAGEWVRCN
jgi:hypothetical protein